VIAFLGKHAATMANPLTRDARGYESQFATNHLEHFQLVARLWPALRRAKGEPRATDPEFANQLWHWSEKLTAVSFPTRRYEWRNRR
jgi:hypothetical protein